jgi:hypothetical protein
MPMIAVFTAAEIAAAEAAAITAAEVAAATAAEIAAAEAAAATAATAAAPLEAATVASQAVPEMLAGAPSSVAAQPTVAEFLASGVNPAGMTSPPPAGILQAAPAAPAQPMAAAGSTPSTTAGVLQAVPPAPAAAPAPTAPPAPTANPVYSLSNPAPAPGGASMDYNLLKPGQSYSSVGSLSPSAETGLQATSNSANTFYSGPQPSMFDKAVAYAKQNPFQSGMMAFTGMKALEGKPEPFGAKPYDGPLTKYRLSPDFQTSTATPNVYKPTYPTYAAEGGVMSVRDPLDFTSGMGVEEDGTPSYAVGGATRSNSAEQLDYFKSMLEPKRSAPADKADVGIYQDLDPDTRYQDALTAAQIRNAKIAKRANMRLPSMRRPTPMGQINLAPPGAKTQDGGEATEAAQGGIMQASSSLGGYAAGGNPRLLKGPGDGMSDDIPAMIGRKQPARLADGEFVIPADVVSHLGNGSTDAGAKRLHEMMTRVRRVRTGNPKQGKQINPRKYMPK